MSLRETTVEVGFKCDFSDVDKLDNLVDDLVDGVTGGLDDAEGSIVDLGDEFGDLGKSATKDIDRIVEAIQDLGGGTNLDDILEQMENLGNEAKETEDKVDGLGSKLKNVLGKGLKAVAGLATGAVTGFLASAEASQEFTEDMGKLEVGFKTSGHSVDTAMKSYESMVGILGETDQSVEAVNHLAKLTKSEKELAKWTDISAGVYATFGDSLPLEGLTEASNETAKVGQVTGPLADALNWAGKSEDKFNEQLAKCSSEAERATLITETLTEIYGKAGQEYQKTNADLIASRQATSDMSKAMAEMGQVAMPIMTALKGGVADLVGTMIPSLTKIGDGVRGLMEGTAGAGDLLETGLNDLFNGLISKVTSMLPQVLNIALQLVTSIINGLVLALPNVLNAIMGIIPQITQALLSMLPQLVVVGIELINSLLLGLGQMIPEIVLQVINIIPSIVNELTKGIPTLITGAVTFFLAIIEAIPVVIDALISALPGVIDSIVQALIIGIPMLLDGALQLFEAIVEALPMILPPLIAVLPKLIDTTINSLIGFMPTLLQGALTLFIAIVDALPQILPQLISQIVMLLENLVYTLSSNIPLLMQTALTLFMALVDVLPEVCMALIGALPAIGDAILQGLASLPAMLGAFFKGIWNGIIQIFSPIASWFGSIFSQAWENIKSKFAGWGAYWSNLWTQVKTKFTTLGTSIGSAISGAVKSGINSVISMIENTINKAIGLINGAIDLINKAPGVSIGHVSTISLPRLAEGGIADSSMIANIGEAGTEAVVPLENNLGWLDKMANMIVGAVSKQSTYSPMPTTSNTSTSRTIVVEKGAVNITVQGGKDTDGIADKVKAKIEEFFNDLRDDESPVFEY